MTHTASPCYCKPSDRFLKRRSLTAFLILVMACGTGAFAEDVGQLNNPPGSLPATHLLGFAGVPNNSKGTLSIEGDALQFKKNGRASVQIKIASIHVTNCSHRTSTGWPLLLDKLPHRCAWLPSRDCTNSAVAGNALRWPEAFFLPLRLIRVDATWPRLGRAFRTAPLSRQT
jgi:hypothetical protein